MKKILITYPIPREDLKLLFAKYDATYPEKQPVTRKELLSGISRYDGLLVAGSKVDKEILVKAKNLKIISNYGAGFDNIDVKFATGCGIAVANTPNSVTEDTAEKAFGLMLSVMRRISECDRKLRLPEGLKWGMLNNLGHMLYGKTLGIIGMGRIGAAVARRAAASGMKICYHNRKKPDRIDESLKAGFMPLDELLKVSDVISVHTPLTPETYHLLDEREFRLMKASAFIINTSRGSVLNEKVLTDYLATGKLAGAGLDVFENEPYIPEGLLKLDNVVLTPHLAAAESRIQIAEEAAGNIIDYFEKGDAANIVNREVLKNI